MKIKLDENLPHALVKALTPLGHEVDTIPQEGLTGRDDSVIWEATQRAGQFLITQDLDFSDIRRYQPGHHHGVLLVRLREPGRTALFKRVLSVYQTENTADWIGCFVVVTQHKVRIRRPPASHVREPRSVYRVKRERIGNAARGSH